MRILILCTGNSCRSQMAHGFLQSFDNETCPAFAGNVGKRLHIGFDDPSEAIGTIDFIKSEFERVRNEIKNEFTKFYITEIKKQELPECACSR